MRYAIRTLLLLISVVFSITSAHAASAPADPGALFVKIQGEAEGTVGYFGLHWSPQAQALSVYGYRGNTLAASTRDKYFGTVTYAEMTASTGAQIIHKVKAAFITVARVKLTIKLADVSLSSGLDEANLTVTADGQGQATIRLTRNSDNTLRVTYQNQVTDTLYFKGGQISLRPF